MNLSSVSSNSSYPAQSLLFDRPLVMEDRRAQPEAQSPFPSERALTSLRLAPAEPDASAPGRLEPPMEALIGGRIPILPPIPPIGVTESPETVTQKIEEIGNNPNLTDKQKRAQINELRKSLGISKGDMKKLYTKPLERAYAQKIAELKASGIDTPEKAALLQDLESKKKLYGGMFKSFWSKLGGALKKIGKGLAQGLKTIGKVALGVASAVFNPMSLIPQAISMIGQIPMVGKIVNTVTGAFSKAKTVVDGVVDKVGGWVDKGIGYYRRGLDLYRQAGELPRRWLDEARGIFWGE